MILIGGGESISDEIIQKATTKFCALTVAHFPGTSDEPNRSLPTGHGGKPTEKRDSSTLRLVPSSISLRKLKAMYVSDHQFNEESRVLCTDLKFFVQDEAGTYIYIDSVAAFKKKKQQ